MAPAESFGAMDPCCQGAALLPIGHPTGEHSLPAWSLIFLPLHTYNLCAYILWSRGCSLGWTLGQGREHAASLPLVRSIK